MVTWHTLNVMLHDGTRRGGSRRGRRTGRGDPAPRDWTCEVCLSAAGWELDIEGGPAYVNEDAYRFGDGTGLDRERRLYLFGDVFGRYWNEDAGYMQFEGYLRGQDATAIFFKGGKQSALRAARLLPGDPDADFRHDGHALRRQRQRRADTAAELGACTDDRADDGAGCQRLSPVTIGWDWKALRPRSGAQARPADGNSTSITTGSSAKAHRRSSASFFFNAAEFAAPVDYTTDDVEVAVKYGADSWQASVSYNGSAFRNGNEEL